MFGMGGAREAGSRVQAAPILCFDGAMRDQRTQSARRPRYRFPWRGGNCFRLLVDGGQIFPAMLAAIARARASVLLEMYLCESGAVATRFVDALAAAAGRGVEVCVLLDDFGASGLSTKDRRRLAASGVHLAFYNPLRYGRLRRYLFRDHRKLLLVDGEIGFTGGVGITDEFDQAQAGGWRETVIEVRGPSIADWHALFVQNWSRWARHTPRPPPPATACPDNLHGRVSVGGAGSRAEIKRSFLKHVRGAGQRAWVCTAYFVPSWKLLRALRRAARRGRDVRLLLPGRHTDHPGVRYAARRHYARLLRNGVRIFEYRGRVLHAKTFLCDQWVSVGSSNIDRWNLRWNLEANQEVDDHDFADRVAAMLEDDFGHCRELRYERWQQRPWWRRLQERMWGYVDIFLQNLRRPKP
jgi:cardiolipin synthase